MRRFFFLGPPHFELDNQPVTLSSAKGVALLAFLAVTGTAQSRERVLALLWPESAPEAARKTLRNTLWAIRKTLGEDAVQSTDDLLDLASDQWSDVRAFEQGTGVYLASLLDGFSLPDAPEFEGWLAGQRERLAQKFLRQIADQLETQRAHANWGAILALASQGLARDPLHEPFHRALIEAHARLGARADALRQYEVLRTALARELSVEPLPETQALRAAVLAGTLSPAAPPDVPTPSAARAAPPRPTPAAPFVGRTHERAALDQALQRATTQGASVALLAGEMGIGKSRLWQEWAATLDGAATVLATRCLESAQSLPFVPLVTLFNTHACRTRLNGPHPQLAPLWLAEIARLIPDLRAQLPDLPVPAHLSPDEERRRLFESLTQFILSFDGKPLVLFVDDVHWADHATLDWLGYLTHRLADAPLLLVLAYRPEEAPAPLAHLLAGWNREGRATRIALDRLTPAEALTLVQALGGTAAIADRAQAQSAGNPYFLIELCRAAPDDVPPELSALVRARLARLPETARQVLQAAAVLAPEMDFALLRRTSGRGEEETLDALDALLSASVLVEQNAHYAFTHPLLATVVADDLSGARRAFLHRRAAEALELSAPGRLTPLAGRLAMHYEHAGQPERAAHYAVLAAEHALSVAAFEEAIAFYRRALALAPTPAQQLGLGHALYQHGDLPAARAAFESARRAYETAEDHANAARASLFTAQTFLPAGRPEEVTYWVQLGLRHLQATPAPDPSLQAQAHFLRGAALLATERSFDEAEQQLQAALELASTHGLTTIGASSRFELGNLRALRGDFTGAVQAFEDSITVAQTGGDVVQIALGHNNAAYHALLAGDLASARTHVTAGLALVEAHAMHMPLQYLYSTRGELALAEAQWSEAEDWFTRGLAEATRLGNHKQAANYHANLALAARGRGDLDSALMQLERAQSTAAPLQAPHLQTQINLWLAEVYWARREHAAAREALARAQARITDSDRHGLDTWAQRLATQMRRA